MIEEQGRVAAVDGDSIWVETIRNSTCTSCSARQGCGQHLSDLNRKYRTDHAFAYIRVASQWSLSEGDRVILGIPESSLLKASALVYLLPLVMMMGALWLASLFGGGDAMLALAVAGGLLLGFLLVRKTEQQEDSLCRVKVVRVISGKDAAVETLSVRNA